MTKPVTFSPIHKMASYGILRQHSIGLLIETIGSFLGCKVNFHDNPRKTFLDGFGINIMDKVNRGVYPIDDRNVLILGRIMRDNQLLTAMGFHLVNVDVKNATKMFNILERCLTKILSTEFPLYFENCTVLFGDELVKRVISDYVSRGTYDYRQIRHLVDYFFKLRTTSFEGEYFSTGAIFSKSQDIFDGTFDSKRFGSRKNLSQPFSINKTNKVDKRIWYLVDGKTSFLLGDKNLFFRELFILDSGYANNNFLDIHSLALTLRGGDFLIKVENEKMLSIITSDGSEFMFFENRWKYRNYSSLKKILFSFISSDENLINSLLFYILSCAKQQKSSILWFPEHLEDINRFINVNTKNQFLSDNFNISDKKVINHVMRCLTSDGISIINREGELVYFGVIANINLSPVSGISGTGETAASVLCENGLSIKISSDGGIKIFTGILEEPYYF